VVPGAYALRLTKGAQVIETWLPIELDRRAPWTVSDRKAHFEAAMKAHALFGSMSDLVDRIDAARNSTQAREKAVAKDDALGKQLAALEAKLEVVKKKIVATKEGGAITGEERIREHADHLYDALLSWEGRPARTLLERTDALARELSDVKQEFEAVAAKQIQPLQGLLRERGLDPIATTAAAELPASDAALVSACLHHEWDACNARAAEIETR
jgi:hypothetical protein